MSDDEKEVEEEGPDFELLTQKDVTGRLKDIFKVLDDKAKKPMVLNVDAILPKGEWGFEVLRSILWKLPDSVETFSIKFNTLNDDAVNFFMQWLSGNSTLKALYIMGSNLGMEERRRDAVYNAWIRNHDMHQEENNGCTLMRRTPDAAELADEED